MTSRPASVAAWAAGVVALGVTAGCEPRAALGPSAGIDSSPEWVAQVTADGFQAPLAVASVDDTVVMGGIYSADFAVSDRTIRSTGGLDGVVAAFGPGGELRWSRELAGPEGDDFIHALAGSPSGDLFVGGQATAGATFGDQPLTVEGSGAALLAKLDVDGTVLWVTTGRGRGFHDVAEIAAAPDGGAYAAGTFRGPLDLGTGLLDSGTESDAFLARYTSAGELLWVKLFTGAGTQFVSALAVGPNGEVALIGGYGTELVIGGRTVPRNSIASWTPFAAQYAADGTLRWVQSSLVPPDINHLGHDGEHPHPEHAPIGMASAAIAVAPSGAVTAVVSYGNAFGLTGQDFEATQARNLTATQLSPNGRVLVQSSLTAPDAFLFLGTLVGEDDRAEVTVSWTGALPPLGDFGVLRSDGTRSLSVLDLNLDGTLVPRRIYTIPSIALTSEDTVRATDGSLLMAVSWRDLHTFDRDIFLARFR
jgi:hypothetical protein